MPELRSYQCEGRDFLVHKQRALLLDEMGTGKSAQAIAAFNKLGAKHVLIICPPATRYGWERECKVWDERNYKVHVLTNTTERIPELANIVICAHSLLQSPMIVDQLLMRRWTVTVLDEIHLFKTPRANRTKIVMGSRRKGIVQNSVHVWGLTGTPMTNAPCDLWTIFRAMGREYLPEKARDYMGYTRIFCQRRKTRWGYDISGCANLNVLHAALFRSGFALRRTKKEVLSELPDKTYRLVPMEMLSTNAEIKWGDVLRRADLKKSSLGMNAGELAEARKDLAYDKIDAVVEYVKELEDPVVVFGWHREFLERLARELDGALYYGELTPKKKEQAKQSFLDGSKRVFVANIQSAGTGLDGLQHVSSHCVFAEVPWTYAEVAQATDRLHRYGQKDSVLADIIVLRGGVESYIMNTVLKKADRESELLLDRTAKAFNIN